MLNLSLPADYEHITKVKHYNKHESGVECIEVIEHLSFNLGTAFKYVMRRDYKNNSVQDLNKALYYLKRIRTTEFLKQHFNLVHANITKIINAETVPEAKKFYGYVLNYVVAATDMDHGKPTEMQLDMSYLFIRYAVEDLIKKYP
jgi:hypothetical protein